MIFPYQPIISVAPDSEDYEIVLRPEIPVTIFGSLGTATFTGLVDTGSDNTILPRTAADRLGIPIALDGWRCNA
jgi:predicted aspartyl protease